MAISLVIFYIFASLTICGALVLILSNNAVNSVLAMIFTFICAAVVWVIFQQTYLALLLIVVYVGAVIVMFLFVIFMLDFKVSHTHKATRVLYSLLAIVICALFAIVVGKELILAFSGAVMHAGGGGVREMGQEMFSENNLYVFELVDFILLAAMIAAITLTLRGKRKGNKTINATEQVRVKAKDRIRLVDIKPTQDIKEDDNNG